MSSTSRPPARPASSGPTAPREVVRTVTVAGRTLRVAVRHGEDPAVPPLLMMNGIGASLEVLQPFVDALDRRRTVIRFDVPGVGGSPRPVVPYVLATSEKQKGSWWPDFTAWLAERTGDEVPAPESLGSADLPPLCEAPGTYVFDK